MPRNTVGKVVAARQPTHANTMAGNRNSFYYAAMDTIRCKWLQGMTSLLALALAVATIQGLMSCGARSRDTSGETSRSGRGAITLDAATRRQVIIEDVLHREAIRSDRAVPAVSLREERRDFRGRRPLRRTSRCRPTRRSTPPWRRSERGRAPPGAPVLCERFRAFFSAQDQAPVVLLWPPIFSARRRPAPSKRDLSCNAHRRTRAAEQTISHFPSEQS